MIFGVQLKEFHCRGYLLSEFCLYESFKMEKAEIEIHTEAKNNGALQRTIPNTFL
jgi:hypothetical protein